MIQVQAKSLSLKVISLRNSNKVDQGTRSQRSYPQNKLGKAVFIDLDQVEHVMEIIR